MNKNKIILFITLIIFTAIISYLMVFSDPQYAFFLIIIFAGILLLSYEPIYGIYAIFFTANVFNPSIRIGFVNIYASNGLIIITFIFLIINRLIGNKRKLIKSPIDLILAIFIILCIISINKYTISKQLKRIMAYMIFVLSFFISVNLINIKNHNNFLKFTYISTFIGSFYTLYTFFFLRFRGATMRGFGMFMNPNHVGEYMVIMFPLLFYYAIKQKNFFIKLGIIPIFLSFMSSISRTSILSLIIAFIIVNTFFKKNYWYFITSFFTGGLLFFFPPIYLRFIKLINFEDQSLLARITLWGNSILEFKKSPFLGIGSGNLIIDAIPYDSKIFASAFNQFITIMAENGIIGLIIYSFLCITIFYNLIKLYSILQNNYLKNIILCIIISYIAYQGLSLAEDPLVAIIINWSFGIILGLFYSLRSEYENISNSSLGSHIGI